MARRFVEIVDPFDTLSDEERCAFDKAFELPDGSPKPGLSQRELLRGYRALEKLRSMSALDVPESPAPGDWRVWHHYRFICRQELNVVRERIENPQLQNPATFRIIRPGQSEPQLVVLTPQTRSRAMRGHNVVFLPRYNDHTLYERLAEHPETKVALKGKQYPWPDHGPTFFHDRDEA